MKKQPPPTPANIGRGFDTTGRAMNKEWILNPGTVAPDPTNATPAEFPKEHSSGGSTSRGYTVEARVPNVPPQTVGTQIFTREWRTIRFPETAPGQGVTPRDRWSHGLAAAYLLSYEAAEALRWWWINEIDAAVMNGLFFETRLVEHEVAFTYKSTAIGEKGVVKHS